jgi:hypothetical protein
MRWTGRVALLENTRKTYKVLLGTLVEEYCLRDLDIIDGMILKWTLWKCIVKM